MKKRILRIMACFIFIILISNFVMAAEGSFTIFGHKIGVEELKSNIAIESPVMKNVIAYAGVYIFGIYNIETLAEKYSTTSIFIIFILIWLILFVGFSDILTLFSPFSVVVSWIIGGAISILAANVGAVQVAVYWIVIALSFLGAAAIVVGILAAFVGFIALSWGAQWAVRRKMYIEAHRGRTAIAEGMRVFAGAGRRAQEEGRRRRGAPF